MINRYFLGSLLIGSYLLGCTTSDSKTDKLAAELASVKAQLVKVNQRTEAAAQAKANTQRNRQLVAQLNQIEATISQSDQLAFGGFDHILVQLSNPTALRFKYVSVSLITVWADNSVHQVDELLFEDVGEQSVRYIPAARTNRGIRLVASIAGYVSPDLPQHLNRDTFNVGRGTMGGGQ
ncbi:hypothetical protein [Fibrivirga algicola]|uniref:DUF3251 domain-containing protein n=1 Tax=Fibrivirga algicola TaxID=2950420 RepID=A0ABX0QE27_9BACT|nr:hypothetical protein [Fibrivirga algicola]NID10640.1 hypothetical protein [Fibrivirga algicola]